MSESTVRQQYNQLASVYDRRWQHYITKTLRFLKQWAMIPAEAKGARPSLWDGRV